MFNMAETSVLYVIGSLSVGGAERHLLQVAPELARRGWKVTVFCLSRRGVLASQMERKGVAVYAPEIEARDGSGWWQRACRLLSATIGLMRYLRRERPTIVHFFLPEAYLIGGLCACWLRHPHRVMSRRSLNHYQKKRPLVAAIERRLHPFMHLVLGNSRAVVAQLREEGVASERLRLVYNGIDREATRARRPRGSVRAELKVTDDALVFVQVANLIPYKGHDDALRAFYGIRGRLPQGWRVWMVGRDDGIGEQLRARTSELGLAENVQWLGARADVADLLAAADVSLLCSHEEGFSNAILESMAAGLPVIATDVGGNAEAVIDGRTGFIVPAKSPEKLGEALLRVALDPNRRAMGDAARSRVVEEFSLAACVDRYEACYRELLKATPAVNANPTP